MDFFFFDFGCVLLGFFGVARICLYFLLEEGE